MNNKSSYKGECADLGSSVFYTGNIKQTDNFNTVSEDIISYIHQEFMYGSYVEVAMDK